MVKKDPFFRMRELKIYILLLLGSSFTAVRSQTDLVKPPRTKHEEELLAHENVMLVCEGDQKFVWTFKYQDRETKLQERISHEKVGDTHVSKLQLNNSDNQGHYYCHYENTDLSDPGASAGTYVYLFSKDKDFAEVQVNENRAIIKGNEGDQVVLDCRPTHPNLTVVVEHGGKEIHRGPLEEPRVGFVLRNLTKEHKGKYLCKIHEVEKGLEVKVLGPPSPPWLNISMNTYSVVGYDMELHCRILDDNYESEPTFTWIQPLKDNRTSQTTKHHLLQSHMFYTNYLRVRNVALKDSGTYKCMVNIQGMLPTEMSSYISIKETEDPFINVKPVTRNLTCSKGENITWELEVESFPPMPRFEANVRFIHEQFENGTNKLLIEKVAPSDFGEHTVTITTANYSRGVETAHVQLYLTVLSETELKITGIQDTVKENSTVTATCNATGYPMEKITWQYQSCPRGECPNTFRKLEDAKMTYAAYKENHHSSECTFVAKEMARIKCLSGTKEEIANIAVSEFEKRYSFKHNDSGRMKDLQRNSSHTSIETDPFILTCAASRFYFQEVSLTFLPAGDEASSEDDEEIVEDKSTDLDLIKTLAVANVSNSHKGKYVCLAIARRGYEKKIVTLNHEIEGLIPVFLMKYGNMLPKNHEEERRVREAFTFNCSVSGTPVIDITWTKDDQPLPSNFGEFRENNQTITISDLNPITHSGRYACEARNRGGSVRGFLTLIVHGEGFYKALKVTMGIITPFLICLVVVVIVLFRRVRRDFLTRRDTKKNLAFLFERGRPNELNPDCTADEQAELLPYDHKWEVSRDRIQLGQQLGAGAFGRVVKAHVSYLEPGVPKTTVALKMSKTQADPSQIRALTQELKIMVHMGKHLNIVNLLGSYTANVSKGELWILVEYCRYGSLLPFLHRHRHNFENLVDPVTDMVDLTGRDGEGNISPFSPVHVSSPSSPRSPGSPFKSPSIPQSPTRSEKDGYESAQTASSAMYSGTRRPCETLLESPTSPTVPFSPSYTPKEDSMGEERRPSSPRIFRFGDSLPKGMKMVQNPSYQTVPVAENSAGMEEGSGSHNTRKQSLKVLDSQGNYFMYDKSTIPGVTSSFTTVDLICWSWQVAEGMDYLTRRKVLHGDLATRNLLLAEANVVKISDFGLSRDIYMDDIYFKQTNDLLPVKWMSVEAIRDRMFSIQSDIWSFGVTLWELFSLGSTPYPGVKIDHTFLQSLQDGYRMEIPQYANGELYKIMCQCWGSDPQERPSFRYLADKLSKMLMPETTQHYNNKNGEYLNMNEERFKHEKDYLEMLASPDIRNVTRDDVPPQCEDAVDGTRNTHPDLRLHIERTSFAQDQETNYLPMSSCAGSPQSPFDIFSPTKTSETENVFTFGEEVPRKNSNPLRQSCPQRGNPLHQDTQPSHQSLGDLRAEEGGLMNQQRKADEPQQRPNGSLREETGDEPSESSSVPVDNKTFMTRRSFSQESPYMNIQLAPDDSSSPLPSPEITLKLLSADEVGYANLQTVR